MKINTEFHGILLRITSETDEIREGVYAETVSVLIKNHSDSLETIVIPCSTEIKDALFNHINKGVKVSVTMELDGQD